MEFIPICRFSKFKKREFFFYLLSPMEDLDKGKTQGWENQTKQNLNIRPPACVKCPPSP